MDGELTATLNTVLGPDDAGRALELAREAAEGLESGRLEPSAEALEPSAGRLR